jgi:hypothetical protein
MLGPEEPLLMLKTEKRSSHRVLKRCLMQRSPKGTWKRALLVLRMLAMKAGDENAGTKCDAKKTEGRRWRKIKTAAQSVVM